MHCFKKISSSSYSLNGDVEKSEIAKVVEVQEARREGVHGPTKLDEVDDVFNEKTEQDVEMIKAALAANEFLQNVLSESHVDTIVNAMYLREITETETIIRQGEVGSHMYVSAGGTYNIIINDKKVTIFNDRRVFGELAILYKTKRLATVRSVTKGKLWVIHRDVYQKILVQNAMQLEEETVTFLRRVPMINKLNDDRLKAMVKILKTEFYTSDHVIVQEGEIGNKFYIIRAGSVVVTKEREGKVADLEKGAFFGERALLEVDRRLATVTAKDPGVECLTLTRSEFLMYFDENDFEGSSGDGVKKLEVVAEEDTIKNLHLDQFTTIATLGVGGFGRVHLVQHKEEKNLTFAMKRLKKFEILENEQSEHVFNEKEIQMKCNSIFIVRLYRTFRDNKYLYFLMESCLGGDLWTFLHKQKEHRATESATRFYGGCVLEALTYLHEHGCVYRDLKPENLMLDQMGYLKLTDFGFAKQVDGNLTFTFAGTPEYVAPEIIYNRGHHKAVDYWTFGVFIYELLAGKTPFKSSDPSHMKTYQLILNGVDTVKFPKHMSNNSVDIVRKLCRPLPRDRLGCLKNGAQDIRKHKWYDGFDWMKLRARKIKPPYVPKISSTIDTKNFDNFTRDNDIPPDELSGWDSTF